MFFKVNPYRLAFDCDGVLLNFDHGFGQVASDALGRPVIKQNNAYELHLRYQLTETEMARVWSALDDHPQGWAGMNPLQGAREAVAYFKAKGFEIHVVTGIEPRLSETRVANLLAHSMPIDGIVCVGNGKASKAEHLRSLGPVMFVDDRLFLLKEAPFVPHRVWVDHQDDQHGHLLEDPIVQVSSLAHWAQMWEDGASERS